MKHLLICLLATFNLITYSFIGLNYEAYSKITHFQELQPIAKTELDQIVSQLQSQLATTPKKHKKVISTPKPKPNSTPSTETAFLVIPKINVIAPISFGEINDITQAQDLLSTGVIGWPHFTPPNEAGNTLIMGHSSDYFWNENPYATIFTLLPKLEAGDLIKIIQAKKTYYYVVDKTIIEDAENVPELGTEGSNSLILSTCWPIGFFDQRYNVIATPAASQSEPKLKSS